MDNTYSVLMSVYYKEKPEYLKQSMESIYKQKSFIALSLYVLGLIIRFSIAIIPNDFRNFIFYNLLRKKERKKTNVLAERLISLLYWEWRGVTYAI